MNIEEAARKNTRAYFEELTIPQLVKWLRDRTDEYTNDQPTVSDEVFDLGEKVLKERAPKNKYFGLVGAPVRDSAKMVKLPIAMGSLSKVKPSDGIEGWLKKAGDTIIVSDKLDGASAQCIEEKSGKNLYSRGDGVKGQNISQLIDVVSGIGTLRKSESVRGELVMPKKKFKGNLSKLFRNTRNVVSGVVNSNDKAGHVAASALHFVAYEMLRPNKPLSSSGPYLAKKGFRVVKFKVFKNPTVEELIAYYKVRKAKSLYDLDGLVLESPKAGTVAFKVETEVAKTTVINISWELTRHGVYAPTIQLKPVPLSGVTVKNASAYNARYLKDMGIGVGSVVNVTRSGDVIPKIVEVLKKAKLSEPKGPFTWDKNNVNYVLPKDAEEPSEVLVDRLANSMLVLGIASVRSGLIKKLVAGGFNSLEELILADKDELMDAGLGAIQANTLHTGLAKAMKTVDHAVMMKASGIWPKGFGENIFGKVLAKYSHESMAKVTPRVLYSNMVDVVGLREATALKFAKAFKGYKQFVSSVDFVPAKRRVSKNDSLNGVNVAFTGFRNKSMEDVIKSRGAKVNSSVKKVTQILIVPTMSHVSVKTKKAEDNGVQVMDLNTFLKKHKINL